VSGHVGAGVQRIVLSVRGGKTDVVTQIAVPDTSADYGVLIPVPSIRTLDSQPVSGEELAVLDSLTAPRIEHSSHDSGGFTLAVPRFVTPGHIQRSHHSAPAPSAACYAPRDPGRSAGVLVGS
jgi:hypothetical protein